jgi:hypothetical protein
MKTILALIAMTMPATAQGVDMLPLYDNAPKVERVSHVPTKKAKPKKRKPIARKAAPKDDGTRVAAARYEAEDGAKCFAPIAVAGSQWIGEEGAYESAVKAAKELIRWQIGEMAMDPANWKDVKRRCSMSSVGEIAGQVFHRCELVATPCRPGFSNGVAK